MSLRKLSQWAFIDAERQARPGLMHFARRRDLLGSEIVVLSRKRLGSLTFALRKRLAERAHWLRAESVA